MQKNIIKPGRPKVSEQNKKSMSVSINLSTEEKERIEAEASKLGLSLSSFIRFSLKSNGLI